MCEPRIAGSRKVLFTGVDEQGGMVLMGRALFAGFVLAVVLLIGYRAYEGISDPALAGVMKDEEPAAQSADFRGWD